MVLDGVYSFLGLDLVGYFLGRDLGLFRIEEVVGDVVFSLGYRVFLGYSCVSKS